MTKTIHLIIAATVSLLTPLSLMPAMHAPKQAYPPYRTNQTVRNRSIANATRTSLSALSYAQPEIRISTGLASGNSSRLLCDDNPETINAFNQYGQTRLHTAAFNNDIKMIQKLLQSGAIIDVSNQYGKTALQIAAQYGNAEAVAILLKNRARPDIADQYGQTPLHAAALYGKTEAAYLLLNAHAPINSTDSNNQTPLNKAFVYCKESKDSEIAKLLIHFGAYSRHPQSHRIAYAPLYRKSEQQEKVMRHAIRQEARANIKKTTSQTKLNANLSQQSSIAKYAALTSQGCSSQKAQAALTRQNILIQSASALHMLSGKPNPARIPIHLGIECPHCEYINTPQQEQCIICALIFS